MAQYDDSIFKNKERSFTPSRKGRKTPRKFADKPKAERFTPPGGWNEEFQNVFDFVVNGEGNGAIEAVAGGGKTTALVEAIIRYCDANPGKRVIFVAYNVSIKEEGAKRLAGYPVDVMTCHGLGYRTVVSPENWGSSDRKVNFSVEGDKDDYMVKLAMQEVGVEKDKWDDREALMNLVSKAKTCLAKTQAQIISLMDRFGIETSYTRSEFAKKALKILNYTQHNPGGAMVPGKGRAKGKFFQRAIITFDDQVWLPVINNWKVAQYDAVFVDEAQDLSPARRELVKMSMKPDARLFVVGDRFQAIYGFAGADIDSLPSLIEEFNCTMLPLSCTWRCGNNIVKEAQHFNPDINAAAGAHDGLVDTCEHKDLESLLKKGDALISRKNAPLVRMFFRLARKQIRVEFIGKDYGRMLAYRIKSWCQRYERINDLGRFNGHNLLEQNDRWLEACRIGNDGEQVANKSRQIDEHATIKALTEGLVNDLSTAASVTEILDRCSLFSPEEKKDDEKSNCITLSSTHRFKGLERDHVYMLADTYLGKTKEESPSAESLQEEKNLMYVAITRAKKHLTYVQASKAA